MFLTKQKDRVSTAKDLKEEKDWREITDEEWDNMLEGLDKYIEAYKNRLKELKELQDEAARKAAAEADAYEKTIAAASAALKAAANGYGGEDSNEEESELPPGEDGEKREKNWTKKLDTDDQVVLRTAKEAQNIEKTAMSKYEEVQLTDSTTVGVASSKGVTESASYDEDDNKDKIWTITTYTDTGIISNKCQNGEIIDSWEIKYKNASDSKRVLDFINSFDKDENLKFAGSKDFWEDFLYGQYK